MKKYLLAASILQLLFVGGPTLADNTKDEIDVLVRSLRKVQKMFA